MLGPVDHVYYWTRDMDRAIRFYEDVAGLTVTHRSGNDWAELSAPPVRLALHGTDEEAPGSGTVVFRVGDLDEAMRELRGRGAVFDAYVGEVEGFARFATFRDPDANPIQIIEYARHG
jgi:catechol 2,3-dioxygenase-like lactoylglutathione lyase family enzyme